MNLSDLKRAAAHADTIQGNPRTRLTDVHLRIRSARHRRAAAMAGAVVVAITLSGVAVNGVWRAAPVITPAGTSSAPSSVFDPATSWCTGSPTPPPAGRVGFLGLPPEGTVPSSTTGAPLVLEWFGGDGWGKGNVWLFADGRLIIEREELLAQGANDRQTGYLERCLSPAGVESLRGYVLGNGRLLTTDPPYPAWLRARATADGPLIDFAHASIDSGRLLEPESWLQESDWVDKRYRPFVPTMYSFCLPLPQTPNAPSQSLDLLPDGVVDVVGPRSWTTWDLPTPSVTCTTVTAEEAREVVGIFDDVWFGPDYDGPPAGLDVALLTRETANFTEADRPSMLYVTVEPVLPDGQFTCNCG